MVSIWDLFQRIPETFVRIAVISNFWGLTDARSFSDVAHKNVHFQMYTGQTGGPLERTSKSPRSHTCDAPL